MHFTFNWLGEAAVIRYTTDGSTPTLASPQYNAERPRGLGEVLTVSTPGVTDIKWFATDIKGNQSAVQTQRSIQIGEQGTVGGSVPATLALTLGRSGHVRRVHAGRGAASTRRPRRPR